MPSPTETERGPWSLCGVDLTGDEYVVIRWHGTTKTFGASYLDERQKLQGHYSGKAGETPEQCIEAAKLNAVPVQTLRLVGAR